MLAPSAASTLSRVMRTISMEKNARKLLKRSYHRMAALRVSRLTSIRRIKNHHRFASRSFLAFSCTWEAQKDRMTSP
jgi:hypothetical protein